MRDHCLSSSALRAMSMTIARWWEDFQIAEDTERELMLVVEDKPKRKRRRGPRRKKPASTDDAAYSKKLSSEITHRKGDHDE